MLEITYFQKVQSIILDTHATVVIATSIFIGSVFFFIYSAVIFETPQMQMTHVESPAYEYTPIMAQQQFISKLSATNFWHKNNPENEVVTRVRPIKELVMNLRLKGVIEMGERQAIVEDVQKNTISYYSQGETLNGVLIVELKEDSLTLTKGNEKFVMTIGGL